jgi:chromosome partitioning protein
MLARIITIFNQKGGCGKTTIAMHIAGTLGLRLQRSLLIDMDPQGTATRWAAAAPDENPFPASVISLAPMGGKMHREVKNYINNYNYIIVDCPPAVESPVPASALLISDLALIPIVPSPADMWAALAAKQLLSHATVQNQDIQGIVVANMVQRGTNLYRDSIPILEDDKEIPLARSNIGLRTSFRECQLLGSTVHNVPRAKEAVDEVEALVDEILAVLLERKYEARTTASTT